MAKVSTAGSTSLMPLGPRDDGASILNTINVMMIAMTLIGAVVCLRLARAGGLSKLIGAGALSGFLLFFVSRISAGMASTGATTPEAAAWCPPLFALFAVLTLLTHAEDG